MMEFQNAGKAIIVCIGNFLHRDEGFGIHLFNYLSGQKLPDNVEIIDAGTSIMYLRPLFEDSERIIFVDAVVMGREPGTILQMDAEHIISFRSFRPTVHEIGLRDAVNIIKLRKKKLPEIVLVGVEPENLDEGVELSESVKNAVPRVVEQIYGQLKEWGFEIPT